jgi:hypothetical protein
MSMGIGGADGTIGRWFGTSRIGMCSWLYRSSGSLNWRIIMEYPTKKCVLAFVAAMMTGMSCMAQSASHSSWKRLSDMEVRRWEAGSVVFENKLYVFGLLVCL